MRQGDRVYFIAAPVGAADHDVAINDLRDFLLENGAVRAEPVIVGKPASGERPGEVLEFVTLGATLVGSAAEVVGLIRAWLTDSRSRDVISVRVEIDSRTVEIFGSPTYDEEERVRAFVHGQ